VNETDGIITIKIRILDLEKEVDVFVINNKNFKHDFLIGLDLIKKFKLSQDENLRICQKIRNPIKEKNIVGRIPIKKNKVTDKCTINFNKHPDKINFNIQTNYLNYQQKAEISELVRKYKSVFAKDKYDVDTVKKLGLIY